MLLAQRPKRAHVRGQRDVPLPLGDLLLHLLVDLLVGIPHAFNVHRADKVVLLQYLQQLKIHRFIYQFEIVL